MANENGKRLGAANRDADEIMRKLRKDVVASILITNPRIRGVKWVQEKMNALGGEE